MHSFTAYTPIMPTIHNTDTLSTVTITDALLWAVLDNCVYVQIEPDLVAGYHLYGYQQLDDTYTTVELLSMVDGDDMGLLWATDGVSCWPVFGACFVDQDNRCFTESLQVSTSVAHALSDDDRYNVIDAQTKQPINRKPMTRRAARAMADRKDLEYGGYRYYAEIIID